MWIPKLCLQNGTVGVMWLQITVPALCGQWRRRGEGGRGWRLKQHGHPLRPGGCHSSSHCSWGCHHCPLCWYETCYKSSLTLRSYKAKGNINAEMLFSTIVFCVDDSGWWGKGGLFTALEVRSDEPRKQYELAGKMKGTIKNDHTCHKNICKCLLRKKPH